MRLDELYRQWEGEPAGIGDLASEVAESAETILVEVDQQLASASSEEEAFAALGTLQRGLALLNGASTTDSDAAAKILRAISKRIRQLKKRLEELKAKTGATGFSITVGVPWGVSVTVDW